MRFAFLPYGLRAMGYYRIFKIALTLIDLEGEGAIGPAHVAEASQYRTMDNKLGEEKIFRIV
jgi:magnesium chelatase family protein